MADEKATLNTEPAEAKYFMPPHPQAHIVKDEETENPGNPVNAEKSVSDLIQQAVNGLRSEIRAELETQTNRIQADLQAELKTELKGGSELNVKN